jgi:hypothetical protein
MADEAIVVPTAHQRQKCRDAAGQGSSNLERKAKARERAHTLASA